MIKREAFDINIPGISSSAEYHIIDQAPLQGDVQKFFYHPVCSNSEIERIFRINTPKDYLLKLRADTLVDHMRLFRVYRNKALSFKGEWSLENAFSIHHYNCFIDRLDKEEQKACRAITYGDIFATDPNGYAFKEDIGKFITISESLKYFMEFMNLALLDLCQVPLLIKRNALVIAIRIMLQTEALDFFMDPRGIIPTTVLQAIRKPIGYELQYIAGHEFSHFLCNHFASEQTVRQPLFFSLIGERYENNYVHVYNTYQKQELEADVESLRKPNYPASEYQHIFRAALLWFASLELYESVVEIVKPTTSLLKTHPPARDRFENIMNYSKHSFSLHKSFVDCIRKNVEMWKGFLVDDVSVNFDAYERYGSVYLDKPDTAWRGKKLVDRVDYY